MRKDQIKTSCVSNISLRRKISVLVLEGKETKRKQGAKTKEENR